MLDLTRLGRRDMRVDSVRDGQIGPLRLVLVDDRRPEGKGTFLYIAGIHAVGADGVHYHGQHLADLYSEVRARRFSMLISCEFDTDTRQVITSDRITPPVGSVGPASPTEVAQIWG